MIAQIINSLNLNNNSLSAKIIISLCISLIFATIIPIIGMLIDKLEDQEIKLFSKLVTRKPAYLLCNYATFPGTIVHEYSHAMFGALTGAKIINIKWFEFSGNRLGHIEFILTGNKLKQKIQLAAIGCAPVIMGCAISHFLIRIFTMVHATSAKCIVIYLIISILNHTSMSKMDIKNYIRGIWLLVIISIIPFTIIQYIAF